MPLYVRRIYPVYRQRRKLTAWTTVSITGRVQFQHKMVAPAPLGAVGKAQWQHKMNAVTPVGLVGRVQWQHKMRAPAPAGLVGRVQWQHKMVAPAPSGFVGKVQWQHKLVAPAPLGMIGKVQWQWKMAAPAPSGLVGKIQFQWKMNAVTPVGLVGRITTQWKSVPGLQFTVGFSNLVVIDDNYGSDALTRINQPIVSGSATHGFPTAFYIVANKVLNSFDVFSLTFTRPDSTQFTVNSSINIGLANFFSGIGRFIPNMYVVYTLAGTSLNVPGTWRVDLLVNNVLMQSAPFQVA